jgi:hypothetical protein
MLIAPLLIAGMVMTKPVVKVTGDWTVRVPAQTFRIGRSTVKVKGDYDFKLDPPSTVAVHNEEHAGLPPFATGWRQSPGGVCAQVVSYEIAITGILNPESLTLKPSPDGKPYIADKDYKADPMWGAVGRIDNGAITENTPVYIDYSYNMTRVDTIAVDKHGIPHVIKGNDALLCCKIPILPKGERRLANVLVPGYARKLSEEFLFPIVENSPFHDRTSAASTRALIPKTWAKLNSGEPVRILAWGDSVTDGLYLSDQSERWQAMFLKDMRKQFPRAKIELITEAWGGRSTSSYLAEPAGSPKNFREKVLDLKPDLVISEFVNDVSLAQSQNERVYSTIRQAFAKQGMEWIVMTPHYDTWQHQPTWGDRVERDARPHVAWLRTWTAANGIALVDSSERWDHLAARGIPYAIYLTNGINHPCKEGLQLYVDALMDAFGE